jgi:hypothetical protein
MQTQWLFRSILPCIEIGVERVSPPATNARTGNQGRVALISLVFREMWETTALSLRLSIHPMRLAVNIGGIPPVLG